MANDAILKLRAASRATNKSARQDRVGDYKVTLNRLDAIWKSLGTSDKGMGRALLKRNAQDVEALRRLDARSNRSNERTIGNARGTATNLYGSALGMAVDQQLGPASAAAAGASKATGASAIAGQQLAFGAKQTQRIMDAGATEARAAADYAAAQALRYRAQDDARLVMEQQTRLAEIRLQSKLAFENWKKQQDYLKKLETGSGEYRGLSRVVSHTGEASYAIRSYMTDNPSATREQLMEYLGEQGYSVDPQTNQGVVNLALANAIYRNKLYGDNPMTRKDETGVIMDAVLELYPNFNGKRKQLVSALNAQLDDLYFRQNPGSAPPMNNDGQPDFDWWMEERLGKGRFDSYQPDMTGYISWLSDQGYA